MRIRRHANPFSVSVDLGTIDRAQLFGREAPLEVELGPGNGQFLIERARNNPDADFVGIEVRAPMVEAANARALREGPVKNVLFVYANANVNLALAPPGVIRRFHIHFPDPWFKKRHWKRRMVQPATVRAMATLLPIGGEIYAQTDLRPLAEEMYAFFSADGSLESRLDPSMLVPRPFPEATDWELHHEKRGEPVNRMLFAKVREPSGPVPEMQHRPTPL